MKDRLPLLLVLAGALLIGVVGVWPALADPSTLAPRTPFTAGHYLANATARATWDQGRPFATVVDFVGWPIPASFRVLMWPTALASLLLPPLVAVNLTFLVIPLFNAGAGYLLGRAWIPGEDAGARAGALVVGGLVAWHPWVRETLANGQLEQACLGGTALVWALAARSRSGRPGPLAALLLLQALVAVSAPHLALAAAVGLPVFAAVDLWRDRSRWRGWVASGAAVAVGTLLAAAYHTSGYAGQNQVLWPKGSPGHPAGLDGLPEAATLLGLVAAPTAGTADATLHPNYLGLVVLTAALLGARRLPTAAAVAFGMVLFALGATLPGGLPGPYRVFGLFSDSLAQSQSPYRFLTGAVVAAALAAGAGVRRPVVALVLVGAAWLETGLTGARPFPAPAMAFPQDAVVAPFRAGTGPILDLPLAGRSCPEGNVHYVLEALRRLRPTPASMATVSIYGTVPGLQGAVTGALRERPCGPVLGDTLRRYGFTSVVLHTHDPACRPSPSTERCLQEAFGDGERADGLRWWDLTDAGAP